MNTIKIYPEDELFHIIKKDAQTNGISLNDVILNKLRDVYSIDNSTCKQETDLTEEIYFEISRFVKDANDGEVFTLGEASQTYDNFEESYKYVGVNFRSKFGRNFAKQVKDNNIDFVEIALSKKGNRRRGKDNSVMYKVVKS